MNSEAFTEEWAMSNGILSNLEDPNEPKLVAPAERDVWQRKNENTDDLKRIIKKIRDRRKNA